MIEANKLTRYIQVRRKGSGTLIQQDRVVAASQTIKQGDLLTISSDKVTQALALPGSNNTVTTNGSGAKVYGVALASLTLDSNSVASDGSGRTTIPVAVVDDPTEILFRIYNGTASDAEPVDVTTLTDYELVRFRGASADVSFYAMATTTTNAILKLMEKSIESASDEDYGFVWCKVIAAARNVG